MEISFVNSRLRKIGISEKEARKETYVCPFIVPPGEVLEEKINEMGLSTEEFADHAAISAVSLVQLFKGRLALTPQIAVKLEKATDIPADYWNRAEKSYRSKLANLNEK